MTRVFVPMRLIIILMTLTVWSLSTLAACPGCCSGHGGIGSTCAADGRIYCADGTISPSCLCSTCGVATTPVCTGGRIWNGLACVCPSGQAFAEGSCYTPLPATQCGVERWPVKTGTDSQAPGISPVPTPTTIAYLGSLLPPTALPNSQRISPLETTTYVLDGTLISYSFEEDSDYHLVVNDAAGRTMIVEIPHPDCVGETSPFRNVIANARDAFNANFRATTSAKVTNTPVRISGVGFWDDVHGQRGVAPNGVELHPVLSFTVNPSGSVGALSTIVEYYHQGFDHYFITWAPTEIQNLDTGKTAGWVRTGLSIKAFTDAVAGTSSVCRIYIPPGKGDGHYFGRDMTECNGTMTKNPSFILESAAFFYLYPPSAGNCPTGTTPVYRLFSNRVDANHRYTTDRATRDAMVARGWLAEGDGPDTVVMCAPK